MTPEKAQVFGQSAGRAMAGAVSYIEEAHHCVAAYLFGATRSMPGSAPVRAAHDAIAGPAYGGVRAAFLATGWLVGGMASKVSALPATTKKRTNLAVVRRQQHPGDPDGSAFRWPRRPDPT
jgi:biotin transporter BioY